jgi:YD repeat-containing protein
MLRPMELDHFIAEARKYAGKVAQMSRTLTASGPIRTSGSTRANTPPGARRAQSLPSNSSASGTGLNPWWRYQAENIPGADAASVNVGSGNLLLQRADMVVPHKGVPMTFARTYNSQAPSVVTGSYTNWQSLYGNGWTNTFDAHLVAVSTGRISVYDVDGAQYDYVQDEPGFGPWSNTTPGQNAVLAADASCGMTWTKNDGTIYYFYYPLPTGCTTVANAGRLFQIIGPNRNTYLSLNYYWDGNGKVNQIVVQSESGLSATLSFGDINGRRLLQQLTFPDGTTTVSYAYDGQGNLTSVTEPADNAAGSNPQLWYGYSAIGSDSVMAWASSPRWAAQCNMDNCGGDGAYIGFGYTGGSAQASTISSIQSFAVVNPSFSDGYAAYGPLQQNHPTYAYAFHTEYFTTGVTTPTFRDTDGHAINWVVDGTGRPTQTQVCTVTPAQGSSCPSGSLLVTSETWDTSNNRTAVVDPRGAETDMAYDNLGNLVAVAFPPQYQGGAHPTALLDYDQYNGAVYSNIVAICDPAFVHSISGADWNGQYSAHADNYCSSTAGPTSHLSAIYSHPVQQPFGELTSTTSAGGYTVAISHDAGPQGGVDYGLTTKTTGASIPQFDQTTKQPSVSYVYDASGNTVCRQADAGTGTPTTPATAVMTYDSLNRVLVISDPDDASLTGACSGRVAGIANSAMVLTGTYYPDGSLATLQDRYQAASNTGSQYSYDLDGNPTAEAPTNVTPATPTTRRWFDGMDRLIEAQQPADSSPILAGDIPISLRYLFDLSQNGSSGSAATLSGAAVTAHGNFFDTLKNTSNGWIDFAYAAYDAADRKTTDYAFAPCPARTGVSGAIYCSQSAYATRYDWDTSPLNASHPAPGLLVATLDGTGVSRQVTYNGHASIDDVKYSDSTNETSYAYDFDDRLSDAWVYFQRSASHHLGYAYTLDGNVSQIQNSSFNAVTAYSYYADAALANVSATATRSTTGDIVNQPNLYRYAYRNDGLLNNEQFGAAGGQKVSWTYTRGGRMQSVTDPDGSPAVTATYDTPHGLLSHYVTPEGAYSGFQFDPQGHLVWYGDPTNETINSGYNIRGELYIRNYSPNTGSRPGFQYGDIQGVIVQHPTDQWDGRTGAPLIIGSGTSMSYDAVGRLVSPGTLSYDAESRLANGDTTPAARANDPTCSGGGTPSPAPAVERNYIYDGLGQLLDTTYGPTGSPTYREYYWDGSDPLYTLISDANSNTGQTPSYGGDGLGTIAPNLGLTVTDIDFDGAIAAFHNATGHSTWQANNPYREWCGGFTGSLPASTGYGDPNSVSSPPPDDGTSDRSRSVSAVGRVFMSTSMGYTTPNYSSVMPYASSSERSTLSTYSCGFGRYYSPLARDCVPDVPYDPGLPGLAVLPPNLPVIGHTHSKPHPKPPPPPPPNTFLQAQLCGGLAIGTCMQTTRDSCGRNYVSYPFTNFSIGKTPRFGSGSITSGQVDPLSSKPPSATRIKDVLSQGSWNISFGGQGRGFDFGGNFKIDAVQGKVPEGGITMGLPMSGGGGMPLAMPIVPTFVHLHDFTAVNQVSAGAKTTQAGASLSYSFGPYGGGC